MNHPELIKWMKQILLHYISTLNTIFYLEMAPAELVRLGIFVACDCLINEGKQIKE
jgi:hypothetical protein